MIFANNYLKNKFRKTLNTKEELKQEIILKRYDICVNITISIILKICIQRHNKK
jgi:hypothetical protein